MSRLLVTDTTCLIALERVGLLPAVRPVLDVLIEPHAFRLSRALYEAVLREAGEG